jgi:DNA polymerase-3 subunit alpha
LEEEKKALGFFFSGHPLADVRELVSGLSSASAAGLAELPEGCEVIAGLYVTSASDKITRQTSEKMTVMNGEDWTGGALQVVVYPRLYAACAANPNTRLLLKPDRLLFVRGWLKLPAEEPRLPAIRAAELFTLEEAAERYLRSLILRLRHVESAGKGLEAFGARLESLLELLRACPGRLQVHIQLELREGPGAPASVLVRCGPRLRVRAAPELFTGLRQLLGAGGLEAEADVRPRAASSAPRERYRRGRATSRA